MKTHGSEVRGQELQSARPIKRRVATTVSYLLVGSVSQYQSCISQ